MSPSKARVNEVDRMPIANDIALFRSPATWTRKAHRTKIHEQWQGTKKRDLINNLVKWDRGVVTNISSKQARVLRYES